MIIKERITHNGVEYIRTYTTSENMMLQKIGTEEYYSEAIDVIDSKNEYVEVPIPEEDIEEK